MSRVKNKESLEEKRLRKTYAYSDDELNRCKNAKHTRALHKETHLKALNRG